MNYPDVFQITVDKGKDRILDDEVCVVGDGGNSSFQAANLAVQFGIKRLLLVGVDMRLDHGVHWHGRHPHFLNNPSPVNIDRWRRIFDLNAPRFAELGVEVINCSPISALQAYPKMTLREALGC